MARYKSANEIMNQTATEVGLLPINNPVASTEDVYVQLLALLNGCGQELCELNNWQMMTRTYEIVTQDGDDGEYDLPNDFSHMIDQTGWDRKNRIAAYGPLSPQDWSYLRGRDLVSSTIYVSFRIWEGKMRVLPAPPPPDIPITFEYQSTSWVKQAIDDEPTRDTVGTGSDIILFPPLLISKMLKMKWLQAKGFNSAAAAMEFDTLLGSLIGKDTGADVLSASKSGRQYPYLNAWNNVGDSGFGGV